MNWQLVSRSSWKDRSTKRFTTFSRANGLVGPVCSPALAKKSRQSLLQQTKIHAATRPGAWDQWNVSTSRRPVPGPSVTFEHFFLSIQAAVAGLGVAIGPRPLVIDDLDSGRLVAPFGFAPSGYGYYLLSQHAFEQDKRAKAFLRWLQKVACNKTRRKKTSSVRQTLGSSMPRERKIGSC